MLFCRYANRNSLTRDELANERSLLAFVRCAVTMLVAACSLLQALLHLLIKMAGLGNTTGNYAPYYLVHAVTYRYIRPVALVLAVLSIFTSVMGMKKAWLNFYSIAEKAKIKPGIFGMSLLFLVLLAIDGVILAQCVRLGSSTQ